MKPVIVVKMTCLLLILLGLLSSCAGGAPARVEFLPDLIPADLVRINKLAAQKIQAFGTKGANPYVARSSVLFKSDQAVFYVYELAFPPSSSIHITLVSAGIRDEAGVEAGKVLTVDDLRGYWSKYLMPDDDRQQVQSIIDRTYLGRFDFDYASRKGRSYILVFQGHGPAQVDVTASFVLTINGKGFSFDVQ